MTNEQNNFFAAVIDVDNMSVVVTSDMEKSVFCRVHAANPSTALVTKSKNPILDSLICRGKSVSSKAVCVQPDIFDLHEGIKIALEKAIMKILKKVRVKGNADRVFVNDYALKGMMYSYLHSILFSKKVFSTVDKQRKEWKKWNTPKP